MSRVNSSSNESGWAPSLISPSASATANTPAGIQRHTPRAYTAPRTLKGSAHAPCARRMRGGGPAACPPPPPPTSPTRRRSPSATRRSSGSSSRRRSAATGSRTRRSTSTCSSTSRPWRSVARGARGPREDRAGGGGPLGGALRVPPRLPGQRARTRVRLRALGATPDEGNGADRLRARGHGAGPAGQALAPVLALLRVQRLEQHARGRLGDDPARLQCGRPLPRRSSGGRSKSGTASTRAPSGRTWDDDKLELVGGTHPVVYPAAGSHANFFDEALHLGRSASEGVGCDDTSGPHVDVRPEVRTISSDPAAGARAVPLDRVPGPLGRAAAEHLQRADRSQPQVPVDGAHRVVRGLAQPQRRGPRRRALSAPERPTSSAARSRRGRTRCDGRRRIRCRCSSCSSASPCCWRFC